MGHVHQLSDDHAGRSGQILKTIFLLFPDSGQKPRMNFHLPSIRFGVFLLVILSLGSAVSQALRADDTQAVFQSDRAPLLAFENSDKAALALLLNSSFTWINSNGVRLENLTWAG